MATLAVLTPDPADASFTSVWPGVLDRLQQTLAASGLDVQPTPWTAHIESAGALRDCALVLPVLAWGYHTRHADWLRACDTWRAAGVRMANPPAVLAWNCDKHYLQQLDARGVATVPTYWTVALTQADVDAAFEATGAASLIVKPVVSAGAWNTRRLHRGEALGTPPAGAMMLQPYLRAIEDEGETSLLYFGGRLSHVVNKRPQAGDFRIQVQFGGRYARVDAPDASAVQLAERALAAVDDTLLYARVDMVRDARGTWRVMELELIEPDFYLAEDPHGGAHFAAAVQAWLATQHGAATGA